MGRLDIGEALGEGFRLVRRRPLDPFVWGLAYFVFGVLPMLLIFWWLSGDWIAWASRLQAHPDMSDPRLLAEQLKFQAIQPLMMLGGLVGRTLVVAAVLRAVLTPQDRGFFYLRLGKTELWLALVLVVQAVCVFLLVFALFIPVMIFWIPTIMAASHHSFAGWEIPLGVLAVAAAIVVMVWLALRFSMAAPMTFAAGQFRLFESWSLTRGHALGLFALYLVTGIIVGCIGLVVEVIVGVIVFAVLAARGFDLSGIPAMFHANPSAAVAMLAPWVIGVSLLFSAVMGVFMALFLGPWARAYAQLSGEEHTSTPFAPEGSEH